MNRIECEFESEILAAAVQSRWPGRVDARLREHVRTCQICSDVAAVGGAIDAARDEMHASIVVPDSGRVWWLAQLRARREATRTAGRPIAAAQAIAFTCAVVLVGVSFAAASTWIDVKALVALLAEHAALAAGMAAMLLLVPAAVCLALWDSL